jgi:5-methylcytosine-specific restriction enzyme subunit McrC
VRQRPGKAFELTIRHAPLHEDNLVNQIVRWLVGEVGRRTRSIRTRSLSLQLVQALSSVRQIAPTLADLDRLSLSPMEDHWRPLIELTRTFLAQGRPDPARGGSLAAVAVLFTLHDLFEAALSRVLSEELYLQRLTLQRHTRYLLLARTNDSGVMKLRPDFRIGFIGEATTRIVGDAKWKRIFDGQGMPNLRESDTYQVVTYLAALQANASFIVCPLSDSESDTFRHTSFTVLGLGCPLDVFGVKVPVLVSGTPEGTKLRKLFCSAIAAKLAPAFSSSESTHASDSGQFPT